MWFLRVLHRFPFSKTSKSYRACFFHVRDFMPQCVTDFSPFTVRIRPGRMMEEMSKSGKNECMKNPSVTGKSSSSSNTSRCEH